MNNEKFDYELNLSLKKLKKMETNAKTDEVAAPIYTHKNFFVRKITIDRLKTAYRMADYEDKVVLDYGCGSGLFLQALSGEIRKGIGLDLDIDVASKIITSDKISLHQISTEQEITKFSNIDIISATDVLEHVKNLEFLLELFKKILVPNGIIIISGPTENMLYKLARKIAKIGLRGNILGEEEHVTNISNIKNLMIKKGFRLKKNVNLLNLLHVTSFTVN